MWNTRSFTIFFIFASNTPVPLNYSTLKIKCIEWFHISVLCFTSCTLDIPCVKFSALGTWLCIRISILDSQNICFFFVSAHLRSDWDIQPWIVSTFGLVADYTSSWIPESVNAPDIKLLWSSSNVLSLRQKPYINPLIDPERYDKSPF